MLNDNGWIELLVMLSEAKHLAAILGPGIPGLGMTMESSLAFRRSVEVELQSGLMIRNAEDAE